MGDHKATASSFALTREQQTVMDLIADGRNVFFTGEAGTGKSALITEIVAFMKARKRKCAVTAMTGLAASLINGSTLHAFLGLGLMTEPLSVLKEKLAKRVRKSTVDRWTHTDVVIVDEISMLPPQMFEKMDGLARFIRKVPDVFMGGMQVVLCGDFAQCEPIYTKEQRERDPDSCKFLFESPLFKQVFPWEEEEVSKRKWKTNNTVLLKQIFRQKDADFQQLLSRIRLCNHTEEDLDFLESRVIMPPDGEMRPTMLRAQRGAVDKINEDFLRSLEPDEDKWHEYRASQRIFVTAPDLVQRAQALLQQAEKACQSPPLLQLAQGAHVILTRNLDTQGTKLVNGSRGVVVGFKEIPSTTTTSSCKILYPEVLFLNGVTQIITTEVIQSIEENGEKLAELIQVPLKLAWALTIHKAQGTSLDLVCVSLDDTVVSSGQAYVCLSRVTDPNGLFLDRFDASVIRINNRVRHYYMSLEKSQSFSDKKTVMETPDSTKDSTKESSTAQQPKPSKPPKREQPTSKKRKCPPADGDVQSNKCSSKS